MRPSVTYTVPLFNCFPEAATSSRPYISLCSTSNSRISVSFTESLGTVTRRDMRLSVLQFVRLRQGTLIQLRCARRVPRDMQPHAAPPRTPRQERSATFLSLKSQRLCARSQAEGLGATYSAIAARDPSPRDYDVAPASSPARVTARSCSSTATTARDRATSI